MSRKLAHILLLSGIVLFVIVYIADIFSGLVPFNYYWLLKLLLFLGFIVYQINFAYHRIHLLLVIVFFFLLMSALFKKAHVPFGDELYNSSILIFFSALGFSALKKEPKILSFIILTFPLVYLLNIPWHYPYKVSLLELITLIFSGISIAVYLLDPPEHEKTERGTHPEEKNRTSPDF